MDALIFDTETNGLLPELDRIHCIVARTSDGKLLVYHDRHDFTPRTGSLVEGVARLAQADLIIGHNVDAFDVLAIQKVYPHFKPRATFDTLTSSHLIWPEIKQKDLVTVKRGGTFPLRMVGRHSLEAWGHRMGTYKGDFSEDADWTVFTQAMLDYCIQDTLVTATLFDKIARMKYSQAALDLEHPFARAIAAQERRGFCFDVNAAQQLAEKLMCKRVSIDTELVKMVPPFVDNYITPKKKIAKTRTTEFNPQSRDHIARHLMERRGWQPTEFTEGGSKPAIHEEILAGMDWPEAVLLKQRFVVQKTLAQVAEGQKAWLKMVKPDGRIHGRVNHNGAGTSRCTHSGPNMAQIPSVEVDDDGQIMLGLAGGYGWECRSLFHADRKSGKVLVGADASGLELRGLAHFMARYDGGAYVKVVTEGDPHSVNQLAAGLHKRSQAKRFIYAWLYGAGPMLLGEIPGCTPEDEARIRQAHPEWVALARRNKWVKNKKDFAHYLKGCELNASFLAGLPALKKLKHEVTYLPLKPGQRRPEARKILRGLDGRILLIRSSHQALNTLLQSFGALVIKKATVLLHEWMQAKNYTPDDCAMVAHVHDEFQIECRKDIANEVGQAAVEAIREAGRFFNLRCPLDGQFKVGQTWAETH